jgi:serine/threonine-protein kinase
VKVCPACGVQYGDDAAFCARDRSPLVTPGGGGLIGQLIAERYQIERKLGQGGMGEVYLARHIMMGRSCAIKVVSPSLSRDPDTISRFNREAKNASQISHPNVCAVYDFGLTPDGLLYLAMEYLEGVTLSQALAKGPIPVERALAILEQCVAGLTAAHDLGIVHRDLKPDNIMLLDQRGRETVKLVDFGIAKAGTGEAAQRVTKTGLVVGTPEYMSPEQLTGEELDGRSDQYSLALVFYRMIAGVLPFAASSPHEAMAKRLTEAPRTLAEAAPNLRFPPSLQAVISRALSREPAARFLTVNAFAEAIRAALGMSGLGGKKDDHGLQGTRVVNSVSRRPAVIAASLVVAGLAAVAVWRSGAFDDDPGGNSGRRVDSGSTDSMPVPVPPPPNPPPPVPPPPTPPPSRDPTDEDFDVPSSDRARRAAPRAKAIADDPNAAAARRSDMAYNYASYVLAHGDRTTARRYFETSCRLMQLPRCSILDRVKDVP